MATNEIIKLGQQPAALSLTSVLRDETTIQQFERILGVRNARQYLGSVAITVANSPDLQECTSQSIVNVALRLASLELSCDPALKQGQMVPFKNKKKNCTEATLIIHYKGFYTLASRTGKYRVINVSEIFKGYEVTKDILTGLHEVKFNAKEFDPNITIGWLGYYETVKGFKKTVYWTVEEIHNHAKKHASGNYNNPYGLWKNPKFVKTMEMKTVLRDLLSWADMTGGAESHLRAALAEDLNHLEPDEAGDSESDIIDGATSDIDADFPPLGPDWQAAKAAKEAEKKTAQVTDEGAPRCEICSQRLPNHAPGCSKNPAKQAAAKNSAPDPTPQAIQRPYPPAVLRERFSDAVKVITEKNHLDQIGSRERQIVAAAIDGIFGGEKTSRYEVCQWLTGHASTKDMSAAQIKALLVIMGINDFDVAPKAEAMEELRQAHSAALIEKGQQQLPTPQ